MELNRHSFLEPKYVAFCLRSMENKSVFRIPQSLSAKLVPFFGSILLFQWASNKVAKNCIVFRYKMSLPSCQENFKILEILIHCWQARLSAGYWRLLRSSTEPSFSKAQSFQGLEIPESVVFFRSCIKETRIVESFGLRICLSHSSLVSDNHPSRQSFENTDSQGMPQNWDFGLHKSCQEIWQCFIGTFRFCKICKLWPKKSQTKQFQWFL